MRNTCEIDAAAAIEAKAAKNKHRYPVPFSQGSAKEDEHGWTGLILS
jgi:hypothetical protein